MNVYMVAISWVMGREHFSLSYHVAANDIDTARKLSINEWHKYMPEEDQEKVTELGCRHAFQMAYVQYVGDQGPCVLQMHQL